MKRGPMRRFVDAWTRLSEAEQQGRLYERAGLLPLFRLVAALFGEELPPARGEPVPAQTTERVQEWLCCYVRTRYYELLNLIALAVYTPFLAILLLHRHWALAVYCGLLMLTHKLALMTERYKRARVDDLLVQSGVETREASLEEVWRPREFRLPPVLATALAQLYFRPKPWERERFYRVLLAASFRSFVLFLFDVSGTHGLGTRDCRMLRGLRDMEIFERQTRVSEVTHLIGILQHVPFAVAAIAYRDVAVGLYVAFMLAVNTECVLLQRWHRARVWPLLHRRASDRLCPQTPPST